MKKRSALCFALSSALFCTSALWAAEETPAPERDGNRQHRNWGGRRGPRGMMPGGGMFGRIQKEQELQTKFSKEYAECVKLMLEAENRLQALAKKAKIDLPGDNNMKLRQIQQKFPAEFAAIMKKMNSFETMREGMKELSELAKKAGVELSFGPRRMMRRGDNGPEGGDSPRMRNNPASQMRQLRRQYPEEMKKIQQLRREGKREEADKLTRELLNKLNNGRPQPPPPPPAE